MKTSHFTKKFLASALLLATLASGWTALRAASTFTPVAMQLKNVITGGNGRDAGTGNIDVLSAKPNITLSGPDLEAFRADSVDGKTLSFAVDVNESASGVETSRAMGVAIKSAKLTVVSGGVSKDYVKYWTETQALIAEQGTTTRKVWYTLLGDAGSNDITSRKVGTTAYDSTLKFEVPDSLNGATAVTLSVVLLQTDPKLGSVEDFYDYSGGFEDLALVTKAVAKVLDVYVPYHPSVAFRKESPGTLLSVEGKATLTAVSNQSYTDAGTNTTYTLPTYPSQPLPSNPVIGDLSASGYQIAAFEDRYPETGDYDFNDLVVAFRNLSSLDKNGKVIALSGDAYLAARGAGYTHRWSLDIPISQTSIGISDYVCNVQPTATSTEIANSNQLNNVDPLACTVELVNGVGGQGKLVRIRGFRDTRELLNSKYAIDGITPDRGVLPHMNFSITLTTAVTSASVGAASPWIEISRSGNKNSMSTVPNDTSPFIVTSATRNAENKPFMLLIPADWQVPNESADIGSAYPDFVTFVTTGGKTKPNWYQNSVTQKVVGWRVKDVTY